MYTRLMYLESVMAITAPQYLYLLDEDLYRLGNATSPRLDHVRQSDVDTYERNGIAMVRANRKGVSLLDEERLKRTRATGWVWKIPSATSMPAGLAVTPDPDPDPRTRGHFLLCPVVDMPVDKYRAALSELALICERIRKP